MTDKFSSYRPNNSESVSMSWRHHDHNLQVQQPADWCWYGSVNYANGKNHAWHSTTFPCRGWLTDNQPCGTCTFNIRSQHNHTPPQPDDQLTVLRHFQKFPTKLVSFCSFESFAVERAPGVMHMQITYILLLSVIDYIGCIFINSFNFDWNHCVSLPR